MNKTTLEDRIIIKSVYIRGKGQEIANQYGVSRQYVGQIVHNPLIIVPPDEPSQNGLLDRFYQRLKGFILWVKDF